MSRVGGDDLARALRAVERERIEALVFHPEVAVEAVEEILRLSPQRSGGRPVAEEARDVGGPDEGGVGVALHLGERNGRRGEGAGRMADGILGVLPAMVHETQLGARHVLEIAIAVAVASRMHPRERSLHGGPELARELHVARPPHVFGKEHDEERRGIDASVVGDERDFAAVRHLAAPVFVQDLAGCLVLEVVVRAALPRGEKPQRARRDTRVVRKELQRRDDAVAAERCDEPRDAGVRHGAVRRLREQHLQVCE